MYQSQARRGIFLLLLLILSHFAFSQAPLVGQLPPLEEPARIAIMQAIDQALAACHQSRHLITRSRHTKARELLQEALHSLEAMRGLLPYTPELETDFKNAREEVQLLRREAMQLAAGSEVVEAAPEATAPEELEDLLPLAGALPSPLDQIAEVELFPLEADPGLEQRVSAQLKEAAFDFPIVLNASVLRFLDYYQGRGKSFMNKGLHRVGRYLDFFQQVFEEEGIPRDLVYMAHIESLFEPRAYSRAHARGIWQFVAGTARSYGLQVDWWVDERSHVEKSTRAAARHLKDLYEEFQDWSLALAAYNVGAGRIRRILSRHGELSYWEMAERRLLPRETRNYVPSILASILIFKYPHKFGFEVEPESPLEFETVPLDFQIDLRVVADVLALPTEILLDLNPHLRRSITPSQTEPFLLRVPLGRGSEASDKLAQLPAEKRLKIEHHRVRRGETLSHIARRYRTSIRAIAEMNQIRNVHRLRPGQDLLIPGPGYRSPPSPSVGRSRSGVYIVKKGDSLYRIARRYRLTVKQIARWNGIDPKARIYPGQRLRLKP